MNITLDLKSLLIGILFIALIVLAVFLIVLISKLTDTVKKANSMLDSGMGAASNAKAGMDNFKAEVMEKTAFIRMIIGKAGKLLTGVADMFIK